MGQVVERKGGRPAGAGQGLEGGPGSLIKVTGQGWLPLPEEDYPESRS